MKQKYIIVAEEMMIMASTVFRGDIWGFVIVMLISVITTVAELKEYERFVE